MKPVEILDNLFFCRRGFLNGNHFICRSDPPVLIDTAYHDGLEETLALIRSLDIDPASISSILNTHTHCDHIGGNRAIQEMSGCDIVLHAVGKHFIESRDDWATWWRYYHQKADFFTPTRGLADGDEVRIGDHRFRVFHTPGHAADGIVLYNPDHRLLISSDTLWGKDMAVVTQRVEGSLALFQLKAALERLSELDIRIIYPGHGDPFTDGAGAISRNLDRIDGYLTDRRALGFDLLKKITVYTLLMNQPMEADTFRDHLFGTIWYPETVDFYFDGEYDRMYEWLMAELTDKGVVVRENEVLSTTVVP